MSWRDQKNAARQIVHNTFQVPVRCRLPDISIIQTTARIHTNAVKTGDLESDGYAERHEITPQLVFLVAEFEPKDKTIVITEDNEAYYIDNTLPPDGITVTCDAVRLNTNRFASNGLDENQPFGGLLV